MDTDFLTYIKLIGLSKAKENLKISLNEAIIKENWELVKKISDFFNIYLNDRIEEIKNIDINQFDKSNSNQIEEAKSLKLYSNYAILEILENIICKHYKISKESINFETNFDTVVYEHTSYSSNHFLSGSSSWSFFGSPERYELIMAVEEEFDIEISDERAEQIRTVKDLYDFVIYNV